MADLCTVAELASHLQSDLDTATATLARDRAQGLVRRYAGQEFTTRSWVDVVLAIQWDRDAGWYVRLPQRPVTAVTAVTIAGSPATWALDRLANRVVITSGVAPEAPGVSLQATVSYTSGLDAVPDDVKDVVLSIAGRIYDNPTGVRSRSIDDYSEGMAGTDADLAGSSLLEGERRILDEYRRKAGSTRIRS